MSAALNLQTLIGNLGEEEELLRGLEVNLSLAAYQQSGSKFKYPLWAKEITMALHGAILVRLNPSPSALVVVPTWISASAAQALAEDFQVPLTLSYLSRLARKRPPVFDSRTYRGNKLFIRLDTFVKFLWAKRSERRTDGATDEEAGKNIKAANEAKRTNNQS